MKKLLKYLNSYKLESVLGPLFKLLEASFELMVPLVMAKVIDVGIKNQDVSYILKMGGLLVLLGVIGLTCSITAQYFAAKAAAGFGTSLRNDLFAHINRFSYAEIDKQGTATLITRMTSDANQVQSGVNLFLRLFLRSPFIVVGAMVMAFSIDVKAAMIFVVVIPVLSVVVFGIMLISMPLYKKVQRQLDRVLLTARENLSGVRVIRAFNRQDDEIRRFDEENGLLVRFQIFVGKISALLNPLTYVIINLGIIVLIQTGAREVEAGVITQGEVVALVNYMSQILVELIKLANLIISISKALACANRINSVFEEKPGIVETVHTPVAAGLDAYKVEFKDMVFTYGGSKEPALEGLSFQVKKGQTVGIIGGTGSAKTTLVQLIPRLYEATEGEVRIDGKPVKSYPLEHLRDAVAVVLQKNTLFSGTIEDNLRWGKEDASREEMEWACKIAGAAEFVERFPDGYDTYLDQGGVNLSGGQKQRLCIARAVLKRPRILILDDSTSAVDTATETGIRRGLRESLPDMTKIIIAQRITSVQEADQIIIMEDGKVHAAGTHKSLLASDPIYQEIYSSQHFLPDGSEGELPQKGVGL